MTLQELLDSCHKMGFRQATDVDSALEHLKTILKNDNELDGRKQWARDTLQSFAKGSSTELGVMKAKQILAECRTSNSIAPPLSRDAQEIQDELYQLIYPMDPGWLELLPKLQQHQEDRLIRDYGERLVNMTNNYLEGQADTRTECLLDLQHLIDQVLKEMDKQLDVASRIQLQNWSTEIGDLKHQQHIDDLLTKLNEAHNNKDWEQMDTLVKELGREEQHKMAQPILDQIRLYRDQVRQYHQWRKLFDNVLEGLEQHYSDNSPPVPLLFPWDPGADTVRMELRELDDAAKGITTWGNAQDGYHWREALEKLSSWMLQNIQDNAGDDPVGLLTVLQERRRSWPQFLGELPQVKRWLEIEAVQQEQIERLVKARLQTFRDTYRGEETAIAFLTTDPAIQPWRDHAKAQLNAFVQEQGNLKILGQNILNWRLEGNPERLRDGTLVAADRLLKKQASAWGMSPFHQQLSQDMATLQQELEVLEKAIGLLQAGRAKPAFEALQSLASQPAERLKKQALQYLADQQVRRLLEEGKLEDVTQEDLAAASVEMRGTYAAMQRGRDYVAEFKSRVADIRTDTSFYIYAQDVLGLSQQSLPKGIQLTKVDEIEWQSLRDGLLNGLDEKAAQISDQLLQECQPFPLLDIEQLQVLENRRDDLLQGLKLPNFNSNLAQLLRDRFKSVSWILRTQQACHDQHWKQARELAEDEHAPLSVEQHRKLQATVLHHCLLNEAADDANGWLNLYRRFPDLLLLKKAQQTHYLDLLRQMSLTRLGDLSSHLEILQERFAEEIFLIGLLRCAVNPTLSQVRSLIIMPQPGNEGILQQLLLTWSNDLDCYRPLKALWEKLDESLRRQVWNEVDIPSQKVQRSLDQRLQQLKQALADRNQGLRSLDKDLEGFQASGLLEDNPTGKDLLGHVQIALKIERQLAEYKRVDPWEGGLRLSISETKKWLESLPGPIAEARGWKGAIQDREQGIRVWERLLDSTDGAWVRFQQRFRVLETRFHQQPDAWKDFLDPLERWCNTLMQALPLLNWDLPKAYSSHSWKTLRDYWQNSVEGQLWQARGGTIPEKLDDLYKIYQAILEQTKDFAILHANLFKLFPKFDPHLEPSNLSEIQRESLEDLHQIVPLSRPVRDIKQYLSNSQTNPEIGIIYTNLFGDTT